MSVIKEIVDLSKMVFTSSGLSKNKAGVNLRVSSDSRHKFPLRSQIITDLSLDPEILTTIEQRT